jgi:dipeptidyl aminopeptidase B
MQPSNPGSSSDHAGSSSLAEMKQKNMDTVNPFIARPATYYGDGPFDPPSSDDDGEEADGSRHSSEHDAESVLLLNVDKSGPSSPGRAERGDQTPRRTVAIQKVRPFNGVYRALLFLTLDPGVLLQ